ncbi:MAG: DUF2974 domain-containing protein [Cellulosilyticum sp.]|nr:DUF2974 domain-containing protein [Cellulosilyticum sp.]
MSNILDYILWRGDLAFNQSPFNEIDNLILAKLSYLNLRGIVGKKEGRGIPLKKIAEIYFQEERDKEINTGDLIDPNFFKLLRLMAESQRYQNIKIKMYVDEVNIEEEMQFAALTVDLGNHQLYVAYRGTDDTLVGWKEDFKMSVMDIVPAQREALTYLKQVAMRYRGYKLYIGGHSKGGNLAVFSAVHASEAIKKRIVRVYNNDGPGFKETLIGTKAYQSIADRVVTFVPQSSIIGMLLEHEEDYMVIQSNQKGFLQHDGFSWDVCGTRFVHLKKINPEGQIVDRTIKRFLNGISIEQREHFTNTLFDILSTNEKKTLTDIREDSFKAVIAMIKTYDQLEKETKKAVTDTIGLLLTEGIKSIFEVRTPEQWKEKFSLLQQNKLEEKNNDYNKVK